jgi:hypothetical protein
MAGYSRRSLEEKLGLKPGMKAAILHPPAEYNLNLNGATAVERLRAPLDFIQFFSKAKSHLERNFPKLKAALTSAGSLWISWPKGSSGVSTDLNEDVVRQIGLANGLVDVKVIAVDDTWSGLKFVYRLQDRK